MLNGFIKEFFGFINNITLDEVLQSLLAIGGVIFLYFKITNSGLDIKIKSILIKKNKKKVKKEDNLTPQQRVFKLTEKKNKNNK
jgi:hypothetical protein